jgi:hypothetical protein
LVLLFEAVDIVANLALAVEDGEVGFVEFVELENEGFGEFGLEILDDVGVFELLGGGVVVDDGEEGEFSGEHFDDGVVGWWFDVVGLLEETVFLEDLHLLFEDVFVV